MKKVLFSVFVLGVLTIGVFANSSTSPVTATSQGTDYSDPNSFPIQPPV
jgi:hypothetical protein